MIEIKDLIFGRFNHKQIKIAIVNKKWQEYRLKLKGMKTRNKIHMLEFWLVTNMFSWKSKVQVTNYINALKRGGQLSKECLIVR